MAISYKGNNPLILDLLKKNSSVIDSSTLHLIESLDDFQKNSSNKDTIYIGENLSPQDIFSTIQKHKINHIVQKTSSEFEQRLNVALNLISKRNEFIKQIEDKVGMDADKRTLKIPILEGSERFVIYEKVKEFLTANLVSTSISEVLLMISYELLSNVLYDAPYYYEQNFKTPVQKKPNNIIGEFIISLDSNKAFIAASDDFGSLDIHKMIDGIVKSYQSEMITVKDGPVGAGIGCRMMFDYLSDIYILVEQMKKTFIGGTLPVKLGLKRVQTIPKGFHFFEV